MGFLSVFIDKENCYAHFNEFTLFSSIQNSTLKNSPYVILPGLLLRQQDKNSSIFNTSKFRKQSPKFLVIAFSKKIYFHYTVYSQQQFFSTSTLNSTLIHHFPFSSRFHYYIQIQYYTTSIEVTFS